MGHLLVCVQPCLSMLVTYPAHSEQTYLQALFVVQMAAEIGDVTDALAFNALGSLGAFARQVQSLGVYQASLARSICALGSRSFDVSLQKTAGHLLSQIASVVKPEGLFVVLQSLSGLCEYAFETCLDTASNNQHLIELGLETELEATLHFLRRMLEVASNKPDFTYQGFLLAVALHRRRGFTSSCLRQPCEESARFLRALVTSLNLFPLDFHLSDVEGSLNTLLQRAWTLGNLGALSVLCLCVLENENEQLSREVICRVFAASLESAQEEAVRQHVAVLGSLALTGFDLTSVERNALLPSLIAQTRLPLNRLISASCFCTLETKTKLIAFWTRYNLRQTEEEGFKGRDLIELWGAQHALSALIHSESKALLSQMDWADQTTCLVARDIVTNVSSLSKLVTVATVVLLGSLNTVEQLNLAIFVLRRAQALGLGDQSLELNWTLNLGHGPEALRLRSILFQVLRRSASFDVGLIFDAQSLQAAQDAEEVSFIVEAICAEAIALEGVRALLVRVVCRSINAEKRTLAIKALLKWLNNSTDLYAVFAWVNSVEACRVQLAVINDIFQASSEMEESHRILAAQTLGAIILMSLQRQNTYWNPWLSGCLDRHEIKCFTDLPILYSLICATFSTTSKQALTECWELARKVLVKMETKWSVIHGALYVLLAVIGKKLNWQWLPADSDCTLRNASRTLVDSLQHDCQGGSDVWEEMVSSSTAKGVRGFIDQIGTAGFTMECAKMCGTLALWSGSSQVFVSLIESIISKIGGQQ